MPPPHQIALINFGNPEPYQILEKKRILRKEKKIPSNKYENFYADQINHFHERIRKQNKFISSCVDFLGSTIPTHQLRLQLSRELIISDDGRARGFLHG